ARWRLHPYSSQGHAADRIPHPRYRRGGAEREVRLPARCTEVRCAAARWPGLRPGPPSDADDWRAIDSRGDRLPENSERGGRHDPGAGCGGQQGTARIAYSPARAAQSRITAKPEPRETWASALQQVES